MTQENEYTIVPQYSTLGNLRAVNVQRDGKQLLRVSFGDEALTDPAAIGILRGYLESVQVFRQSVTIQPQ